ncbi:hypothetical protein [Polyangium jinanense]|uniref:hypothetical protein n=1 Tax=Polyangium jinanense TaxID=2829994 RepID=UPI002340E378|nr:hypothetical protein [Polyangium jinanense]
MHEHELAAVLAALAALAGGHVEPNEADAPGASMQGAIVQESGRERRGGAALNS